MALGGFGGKLFEVSSNKIYTFDDYNKSFTLNVESQEVDGDKPSSYIKGKGLQDASITIKLRQSSSVDVQTEVEDWGRMCEEGSPYMLFLGDNPVSVNKFLVKKVDVSDTNYFGGTLIKATLKLEFEEYVRAGVKKEDKSQASKSSKAKAKAKGNGEQTMSEEDSKRVSDLENQVFGG